MKPARKAIYDKFGGRCAYCGCELTGKWCVDHIEPIMRKHKLVGGYKNKITGVFANNSTPVTDTFHDEYKYQDYKRVPDGCHKPELDTVENSNPACFSCNSYKSTFSLELFREQVGQLVCRLNKYTTQYKIAKRYGLIEETNNPVVFYFEIVNKKAP